MNSDSGMISFLEGGEGGYGNNLCFMLEGDKGNGVEGELGFLEMLGLGAQIPCGYMFEEVKDHREFMSSSLRTNMMNQLLEDGTNNAPGTPYSSSITLASTNEGVAVESEHEKGEEDGDEDQEEDEEEQCQEGSVNNKKL